jgi:hypothetical protein
MGIARTCWALILGLCCATSAHAQTPPTPAPPPSSPPPTAPAAEIPRDYALELSLGGYLGPHLNHYDSDSGVIGGSALARTGVLEAGAQLSFAAPWFFGTGVLSPALIAGLGWQTAFGLRLDLLGVLGADFYHDPGAFLSRDPGSHATLGFYGARAGVGYRFGSRYHSHIIAGVLAGYERDFGRVTRRYSYYESSWFGEDATIETEAEHTFGDRRIMLGLYLTLAFDLMPRDRRVQSSEQ